MLKTLLRKNQVDFGDPQNKSRDPKKGRDP
jgi:hypothetical protein